MTTRPIHTAIDIGRAEREVLRWVILDTLWHARPYGCDEQLLLSVCESVRLRATRAMLRAEMNAVALRGLATLDARGPIWAMQITADGEAVVDYRSDCPADIARPPRW